MMARHVRLLLLAALSVSLSVCACDDSASVQRDPEVDAGNDAATDVGQRDAADTGGIRDVAVAPDVSALPNAGKDASPEPPDVGEDPGSAPG